MYHKQMTLFAGRGQYNLENEPVYYHIPCILLHVSSIHQVLNLKYAKRACLSQL